ncbi:MAG: hypothetical protein ABEN55_04125 [Bradymonadaceae bacterium]
MMQHQELDYEIYYDCFDETAPDDATPLDYIKQASGGLPGEVVEWQEARERRSSSTRDIIHEEGDIWWYATLAHKGLTSLEDANVMVKPRDVRASMLRTSARLAGDLESLAFQKRVDKLGEILCHLEDIFSLLYATPHDTRRVWAANLDKLDARYPDGFKPGGGQR